MLLETLFLLLPLAALTGWIMGRRALTKKKTNSNGLPLDYLKGLNFLLDEQPDKAIDLFIQMLEVNNDTVETHLALGSLFRRRGEVDRAIRIHQNLIARPTLLPAQRAHALFELGQDYMKAGLFDRAETLFGELVDITPHSEQALEYLLDIYQQEKDWPNAIKIAQRLAVKSSKNLNAIISHFYCEQAETAYKQSEPTRAMKLIKKAASIYKNSVRASLLEAKIEHEANNDHAAIKILKRIEQQDADYLPEILGPLLHCYEGLNKPEEMLGYLRDILSRHDAISIMLNLSELLQHYQNDEMAENFIEEFLHHRPSLRAMDRLIDINIKHAKEPVQEKLRILKSVTGKLLEDKPIYKCHVCGFHGKTLHWQCPGCKRWDTVKPIQGVEGE
ncbi:MAG: lipopolysaccharide assembly protein LapB [Woeseiaceae bacterium]